MAEYRDYAEGVDHDTIAFHLEFLRRCLRFLDERGIRTRSDLRRVRARKLLDEPLWKISEANTRVLPKHNLRFYSQGAHKVFAERNVIPTSKKRDSVEHEHIVPLEVLEGLLLRSRADDDEIVRLATFSVGCIVTEDEHRRLPENPWTDVDPTSDPWKRYREARNGSVRVWDRKRGGLVDLTGGLPI